VLTSGETSPAGFERLLEKDISVALNNIRFFTTIYVVYSVYVDPSSPGGVWTGHDALGRPFFKSGPRLFT
jgi:hypothetical protein